MTQERILQIIREEIAYENNLIFEGVDTYRPTNGYRNNQLIEVYGSDGKQLINEGMIDTVQSVLDYAGFIPGIGDLLDGINALIYMIRKKYFLGVTSLVAVIPAVGSIIAAPFKTAHKLLGKAANKLGSILGKMVSNGKSAANELIKLLQSGGSKLKGVIDKIYKAISKNVSKINSFLDKVIPTLNNKIKDYSWGYFALPSAFVKSGNAIIKQMKQFFTQLGKPASYQVTKKVAKSEVKSELTTSKNVSKEDIKIYGPSYEKADKKKYPTFEKFVIAAKEYNAKKNKNITKNYKTDDKGEYIPQSQRA
tara:strand:+ start:269 stop:1192 length:924 start_codon:yes stop_codon:yes gene_type:complete